MVFNVQDIYSVDLDTAQRLVKMIVVSRDFS